MIRYLASNVHGCSIEDKDNTVLLSDCKMVLTTNVQTSDSILQLLFSDDFSLDGIPFDEELILSTCEKFVLGGRNTQPPKLPIEMAVH